MKDPMKWITEMSRFTENKITKLGIDRKNFSYNIKPYGYNGVYGGAVPKGYVPNEILVVLTVTAVTQGLATKVAKVFNPYLLHFPVHRDRQLPSFAFPYSPAETERGQIYEFKLYHVIETEDPMAHFTLELDTGKLYRPRRMERQLRSGGKGICIG